VKCCATFEELERQQRVLDVYRTRCLFVSGEPVTFDQILLKREAEKKAFTEMASLKQAETLEKIIGEYTDDLKYERAVKQLLQMSDG
jgi:hypothetical protein